MGVDFGATNLWADNPKFALEAPHPKLAGAQSNLERSPVCIGRNLIDDSII